MLQKNALAVQRVDEQPKQAEVPGTVKHCFLKVSNHERRFTKPNTNIINTEEKR